MDDYVRQMESLQKDVARRRQAGETFDDVAPKLALMVEMQKRVGSTVASRTPRRGRFATGTARTISR